MGKTLLKFKLDDGTEIYVESQEGISGGLTKTSKKKDNIIEVDEKFETLIEKIKPVSSLIMKSLKDFNTPDDIELSFGVKFGGKAGIIFASVDSEATFNLKLKWSNPK